MSFRTSLLVGITGLAIGMITPASAQTTSPGTPGSSDSTSSATPGSGASSDQSASHPRKHKKHRANKSNAMDRFSSGAEQSETQRLNQQQLGQGAGSSTGSMGAGSNTNNAGTYQGGNDNNSSYSTPPTVQPQPGTESGPRSPNDPTMGPTGGTTGSSPPTTPQP